MKIKSALNKLSWSIVSAAVILAIYSLGTAQPRRGTTASQKPTAQTETSQTPLTLDTLLATDTFLYYLEVRGIGQIAQQSKEQLQPLVEQSVEIKRLVDWAVANGEALATARMLCGLNSTKPKLPGMVCGVEVTSAEEAKKLAAELKTLLTPKGVATTDQPPPPVDTASPPTPAYVVKQFGSLLIVSNGAVNQKDLRPAGHRLLSDNEGFRAARNRFSSENLFFFYDMSQTRQQIANIASDFELSVSSGKEQADSLPPPVAIAEPPPAVKEQSTKSEVVVVETGKNPVPDSDSPPAPPASLFSFFNLFMYGPSSWPDGVALALSLDGNTVVGRLLTSNRDGSPAAAIPFMPSLIPGPAIAPSAASVFPSDTEIFLTASLDYQKIYDALIRTARAKEDRFQSRVPAKARDSQPTPEFESPFAQLERQLGLSLKDDLMPLLGNEMAIALPLSFLDGPKPTANPAEQKAGAPDDQTVTAVAEPSPDQAIVPELAVALSVKNRDAVKELIPRIIESLGFKGAAAWAQTEKREDTELISYAKVLSFAFISDYLIVSHDSATVRRIVDSYLRHETLANNSTYRNSTRWQPRQLHAQLYVSPALIESFKAPKNYRGRIDERAQEFYANLNPIAEPTSYALVNESVGTVHEVRVSKDLLKLMFFGVSRGMEDSEAVNNEFVAAYSLQALATAQKSYKESKGNGKFGQLEDLFNDGALARDYFAQRGYRFSLIVTDDGFEATAVPEEYGKTGKLSFFIDQSGVLRAGDHHGAPANVTDKPY